MMNNIFKQRLLNLVFENPLSKKKLLLASELYLTSSIKILEKENETILFKINDDNINITYLNNRIVCFKNNITCSIDENVVACALFFKREHYIKNEIIFTMNDIQLNNYYYNSFFISNIYFEDYQYRFNFYYGMIDELYKLGLYDYCIKVMVNLFSTLDVKFTYESKFSDINKQNLYRVTKDKYDLLYTYPNIFIESFDMNIYPITTLGKLLYITVVNKPTILKNGNIKVLYQYVFDNYLPFLKTTQMYNDLKRQYSIIEWYNREKDDSFMEEKLNQYDIMYCYIDYLYENKEYSKIYNLFKNYKFTIINNETLSKIIYSYYNIEKYEEILGLFKHIKNISYDMYITYKNDLPLLFNESYIHLIIEILMENSNEEEINKIIELENLNEYKLLILAKKDFNLINDNFNEYLGIYDKQLIKIYQKEITNDLLKIRGYHYGVPEFIMDKLEKLKKVKNGKYYILELVSYVNKKTFLSFTEELDDYCKGLGV